MPNLFIIMGDRDTRKSSTIRNLTGAYNRKLYQVETIQGNIIDIFIQVSSLQESRISPQEFLQEMNRENYQNILLSLWISEGNNQPNGLTYIQHFINANWSIHEIVILGINNLPYQLPQNCPNPNFISNSKIIPANTIASKIRRWWQWL